ncbi:ABC transporter substrate-binding protein [Paenibacillus chondroitinus]|uniref:ABC transporter substrate-binding protein n=1 Tax=Paenibacillus chondroitinus TaxID=59842 RepID=A0ABU6DCK7_9BACL|nr:MULTISPECIES: ABC transporter substrate-binding protein [Paenibacillus]MCY9659890.1 ABC transporter substrate-binding protein [Paenibacillus anseongense]MEB4795492.1 ABC transporter substrate-binding protein [Paenibacillus chondroitinus]
MLGRSFKLLFKSKLLIVLFLSMIVIIYFFNSFSNTSNRIISRAENMGNKSVIQTDSEQAPHRKIVLGFSQLGAESTWRIANTTSIREAAKEAGIELWFENADQSQSKQFEAIRSFIKQKVDVIAIAPVIESGWEPILQEIKQAGIPLIILDRLVNVSDPSLYVTYIGSDFYEEGRKAGKYMIDKMSTKKDTIGIVELVGTEGSTPSISRGKGFRDVIKDRPNFKILKSEVSDFTFAQGKQVMKTFLAKMGGDIDVLYSHNDDMALGAIEAIEEYGLRPGKDIIIISVDGTNKAFEKMAEGKINSVVECNPLLGPNLMQAVNELIQGRSLPKRIVTPESVFTETMAEVEVGKRKY